MRTIKVLAIIGLAVALVGVPALAFNVTIRVTGQATAQFNLQIQVDNQNLFQQFPQGVPIPGGATAAQVVQLIVNNSGGRATRVADDQFRLTVNNNIAIGVQGQPLQPLNLQVGARLPNPVNGLNFEILSLPTLTEWGLIALAVLLAGGMGYMLYRRRPALRPAAP